MRSAWWLCVALTCCLAVTGSHSWSIFSRPESYYDVLGVDVSVRGRELKAAYRRLSLEWHPDKHRGVDNKALAEAKITRINTAYKVLSDDVLRARYDWLLAKGEPEYVGTEEDWKLFDKDPALFEAYHFRDPNTRWGKEPEVSNLSILMAVVSMFMMVVMPCVIAYQRKNEGKRKKASELGKDVLGQLKLARQPSCDADDEASEEEEVVIDDSESEEEEEEEVVEAPVRRRHVAEFGCDVCRKSFKSANQLANHEKSKLHKKNLKRHERQRARAAKSPPARSSAT